MDVKEMVINNQPFAVRCIDGEVYTVELCSDSVYYLKLTDKDGNSHTVSKSTCDYKFINCDALFTKSCVMGCVITKPNGEKRVFKSYGQVLFAKNFEEFFGFPMEGKVGCDEIVRYLRDDAIENGITDDWLSTTYYLQENLIDFDNNYTYVLQDKRYFIASYDSITECKSVVQELCKRLGYTVEEKWVFI